MEALINDPQTQNLDILAIQEPSITSYRTHVYHSAWYLYQSTHQGVGTPRRSLLYINKRISTSSHRQICCDHPDIAAVKIWTTETQMLIFSVYIPPIGIYQTPDQVSIQPMLDQIQLTIRQAIRNSNKKTHIILAGDFNRHHPAWSSKQIHHVFIRHAEELVNFFQAQRLQWCLPRGQPTFWSLTEPGKASTIDLTVTDSPERLIKCHLYHDHYGSDHRATYSEWSLYPERTVNRKPRRAFERADWGKIGPRLQSLLEPWPSINSESDLEAAVTRLIGSTITAIDQFTPLSRPSPYSKRWFTPDLKIQQTEVNQARRRWQESCVTRGRQDPGTRALYDEMRQRR